jgi:hypothetical protein
MHAKTNKIAGYLSEPHTSHPIRREVVRHDQVRSLGGHDDVRDLPRETMSVVCCKRQSEDEDFL